MIDRPARDQVIAAFEDYLDDRITAFDFDARLQEIRSEDGTVTEVIGAAWLYYDDCTDHEVCLSKVEWDYFQRLLLILRSDAELSFVTTTRWAWDHVLAWLALAAFLGVAFVTGWGWHLFAWAVPFGAVSIAIGHYRLRKEKAPTIRDMACLPFASFAQIRRLRRKLPAFQKRRYREEIGGRRIRSAAASRFYKMLSYVYWVVFAPVALLFQGWPSRVSAEPRVE